MTRIIAALLALAAPAAAQAAERRFTLTDFDRVVVEGSFQVTVGTGRSLSAVATGEPRALDGVSVEVQGRTLRVRANRSAWGGWPGESAGPVRIAVTTHGLRGATVNGSGGLQIDRVKAMRFDAALAGSGRIGIDEIEADNLLLGAIGAGTLKVAGKAKTVRATVRGAAALDGAGLEADSAEIEADTSGTIGMAALRSAKVTASGTGDVSVTGSAACSVNQTGAGNVRCGD
jgi:hypothetical protein